MLSLPGERAPWVGEARGLPVPASLLVALLPAGLCWSALSCLSRCHFASAGLLTPPGRPLPLSCASVTLSDTPTPHPALSPLATWSVSGHICLRGPASVLWEPHHCPWTGRPCTRCLFGPLGPEIPQLHVQVFSAERGAHVLKVGFTPGGIGFSAP